MLPREQVESYDKYLAEVILLLFMLNYTAKLFKIIFIL